MVGRIENSCRNTAAGYSLAAVGTLAVALGIIAMLGLHGKVGGFTTKVSDFLGKAGSYSVLAGGGAVAALGTAILCCRKKKEGNARNNGGAPAFGSDEDSNSNRGASSTNSRIEGPLPLNAYSTDPDVDLDMV